MFNARDQKEIDVMAPSKRKEGCTFVGVERIKDSTKSDFQAIVFNFKDSTNATLAHKEFLPKRITNGPTPMTDEEFKKSTKLNLSRCFHIARAFLTEEQFLAIGVANDSEDPNTYADNWLEVTTQIGKTLKENVLSNASVEKVCALKIVLVKNKDKFYSGFPKVPPFISTRNHPKDFKYDPNYDLFEIPAHKPDAENMPAQGGGAPAGGTPPGAFSGVSSGHKSEF